MSSQYSPVERGYFKDFWPDESLKGKWTKIAGDLVQSEGQVSSEDFLKFIQKGADCLTARPKTIAGPA